MKTKEQILEWLQSQPWYELFEKNHVADFGNESIECYVNRLNAFQDRIIICAFGWDLRPGFDFWRGIDKEYRIWLSE